MILENKVAIVTGAGSGIGRGSAMILAQEGARVVVSDINLDNAQKTVAQITASGGQGIAIKTDVGDDDQLGLLIDTTLKIYKRLDIVHSHVGIQIEGTLEQVDPKGMDASWKLNVYAHFMLARLAVPHMKKQGGGSIVLTASNSGVQYDREMIAYATSKHAAVAMTKQMAVHVCHTIV